MEIPLRREKVSPKKMIARIGRIGIMAVMNTQDIRDEERNMIPAPPNKYNSHPMADQKSVMIYAMTPLSNCVASCPIAEKSLLAHIPTREHIDATIEMPICTSKTTAKLLLTPTLC